MPHIVIAANVFESNKKFGILVAFLGLIPVGLFLAGYFVPTEVLYGFLTTTDVFTILFYSTVVVFLIFFLAFLIKSGYGQKIWDYINSGKLKATLQGIGNFAKNVEEQTSSGMEETEETINEFHPQASTSITNAGQNNVPSPLEVVRNLGSIFGKKSQNSVNQVYALQLSPSEGAPIVIVPKTRAPVDDVPRVAFMRQKSRNKGRLAVFIISLNVIVVFTIFLVLFLARILIWGG